MTRESYMQFYIYGFRDKDFRYQPQVRNATEHQSNHCTKYSQLKARGRKGMLKIRPAPPHRRSGQPLAFGLSKLTDSMTVQDDQSQPTARAPYQHFRFSF
jgi:hypothetical protein